VKEAVDNSLDACEEAGILPEINVDVSEGDGDEVILTVEDNGPGIVKRQIPKTFGRLLYGSRFHAIRQSRGQQGIGISAVVMYGQLSTGRPAVIESKIGADHPVTRVTLQMDTRNNEPEIVDTELDSWPDKDHGTRMRVPLEARYIRGKQSVLEYLRQTAVVNPHARITLDDTYGDRYEWERATERLPDEAEEIQPHPHGVELGTLLKLAKHSEARKLTSFLQNEFTRVSLSKARDVLEKAGLPEDAKPDALERDDAAALLDAFEDVKIMAPPTDCLSPIGELLVKKGLRKEIEDADFIATETRPPKVHSGNPFQVDAGIVYGGDLPEDEQVRIMRFANRVPLLYQKGGCVTTSAVEDIDWRVYNLDQTGGEGIPRGPAVFLVHVASTNVPFTSEAKDAIADIPEIRDEIELALRECAREMRSHLRKQEKLERMREKENTIRKILPDLADKTASVLDRDPPDIEPVVARVMNNVMFTQEVAYDDSSGRTTIEVHIRNYTNNGKRLTIHGAFPDVAAVAGGDPKPAETGDGEATWELDRLPSLEERTIALELDELEEGDVETIDLHVEDLAEERLAGAEPRSGGA
jgi:DNA topoisomerase-6 subunit B